MDERILAVDIGGTKVAVSVWSDAERLSRSEWQTLDGPDANLSKIVETGKSLLAEAGGELVSVGVSGGGPLDPERGIILSVPNMAGWVNVPVVERLGREFNAPVAIENDANASALAEWKFGAGQGVDDLAYLTCSTGIGAGLILGGRLYRGSSFLAGEIGHQTILSDGAPCGCGRRGCLEAYASGAGMARRLANRRLGGPDGPRTAKEVVDRAREGDAESISFLRSTASYLALGLSHLIYTLNPRRIILGTIAIGAGDLLLEPLREELRATVWPELLEGVDIVPAALGTELGDWSARAVAETLRPQDGRFLETS